MSPGWIRLPNSSHTEMAILPLLSATLHDRTSCPSFVLVTRPGREKKKKKELVTVPTRCFPLTEHSRQHTEGVFSEAVRSNAGANHDLTVMLTVAEVSVAHQIRKRVVSTVLSGQDSSALLTYFQNYKDDMQVFRSWFYIFNQAHGVVVNIRHRLKKKKPQEMEVKMKKKLAALALRLTTIQCIRAASTQS